MFAKWLDAEEPVAYSSFGNGAAMRVSPAGEIRDEISLQCGYDLSPTVDEIRPGYQFNLGVLEEFGRGTGMGSGLAGPGGGRGRR